MNKERETCKAEVICIPSSEYGSAACIANMIAVGYRKKDIVAIFGSQDGCKHCPYCGAKLD